MWDQSGVPGMPSPIRPLPLVLFLLLAGTILHAQARDVRLSGEPLTMILPDDAKIQSAARLGDSTLAVWGTTALAPDSSVYNTLVLQLLHDTTLIGPQRILTSTTARPFGYVQVLATSGHYVVLWNDRRDGDTATYLQRVDASGNLMGSEELFSRPGISPFGVAQVALASGYQWYWNAGGVPDNLIDSTKAIYIRLLDEGGNFKGAAQGPLYGSVQQELTPTGVPGMTILHRGTLPPLLVDPTGKVDSLHGEAARHFTLPYYLGNDGSIETLEGRMLRLYHTLMDTVAYKTLTVPIPNGINEGSQVISHDSSGHIAVLWASGGPGQYWDPRGVPAWVNIYRTLANSTDSFALPQLISRALIEWTIDEYDGATVEYTRSCVSRGCDNSFRVSVLFWVTKHFHMNGGPPDTSYSYYSVPWYEIVDGKFSCSAPSWHSKVAFPLIATCATDGGVPITRIYNKRASEILLTTFNGSVVLTLPAAIKEINVPQQIPGIAQRGNNMLVGWCTTGSDTSFELHSFSGGIDQPLLTLPPVLLHQLPAASDTVLTSVINAEFASRDNFFAVSSTQSWSEKSPDSGKTVSRSQYSLMVPTVQGWKRAKTFDLNNLGGNYFQVKSYSREPISNNVIEVIERSSDNGVYALWTFAIDTNGNEIWRDDSVATTIGLDPVDGIPLGNHDYLLNIMGTVTRYRAATPVSTFTLSAVENRYSQHPRLARLLGPYFIRYFSSTGIYIDIMDTGGHQVAVQPHVGIPDGAVGYWIIQNPTDSGLALLFGGNRGSVTLLDKHLNILAENIPLSSEGKDIRNPAGVYRNDTLFAVWEDYRNGLPDIYGTALAAKTSLSVRQAQFQEAANRIESIVPNPAGDAATIRLTAAAGARIEVIDSYGRTRMSMPASAQTVIDTRTLPSGAYRVVLRGDRIYDSRGLAVTH
jgi:hypothetical protein